MDFNLTDDEQAEAIKKWWKENGRAIVMGVVIGLAVVVGVRYWFQYSKDQSNNASILYSQIEKAMSKNEAAVVLEKGQMLMTNFSSTSYAVMAGLAMAKVEFEAGKVDLAKNRLQWVISNANDEVQHVARLRLARLLLSDDKVQEAADLVTGIRSAGYAAAYEEVRADIALAKGNATQAKELYRLAMAGSTGPRREFLQMKIDDIAADSSTAVSQ